MSVTSPQKGVQGAMPVIEGFYGSPEWRSLRLCVFAWWGKECLKCGCDQDIHVDHVIPVSWRPDLRLDFHNLQPLCARCNIEKSNLSDADYRPERRKPSDAEILWRLDRYLKHQRLIRTGEYQENRSPVHVSVVCSRYLNKHREKVISHNLKVEGF